ncbi:hypothetical protein [Chitinophaga defluvii]|uniref:Uncharacterized protein n=1 Tax=Chitinophaga defluvii TaxID=3163343 RepID=A0ABV2TDE2_9BACT
MKKITKVQLWQNEIFSTLDLINYCEQNSPHSLAYDSCNRIDIKYSDGIYKTSFSLNLVGVLNKCRAKYKYTEEALGQFEHEMERENQTDANL